jgi:hypothetical protein
MKVFPPPPYLMLDTRPPVVSNIHMKIEEHEKITSVFDVSEVTMNDIFYLWQESEMTSEQIAAITNVPLHIVWDVLGWSIHNINEDPRYMEE